MPKQGFDAGFPSPKGGEQLHGIPRTTLFQDNNPDNVIVVLRSVLMNPLTTIEMLNEVLNEQEEIFELQLKNLLEGI